MAFYEDTVKNQTRKEGIGAEKVTGSLPQMKDASDGNKHKFRTIGLYIAANAGFRKCIIKNREGEDVNPITLEDICKVPKELQHSPREKFLPKMSFDMENTMVSLSKNHLVGSPVEFEKEYVDDTHARRNPLNRTHAMLERDKIGNEGTARRKCSSNYNQPDTTGLDKRKNKRRTASSSDLVLPRLSGMSSVTENLLIRSKRLDKDIEKLKIKNRRDQQTLSRTRSSGEENVSLSNKKRHDNMVAVTRKVSLNLPTKN